MAQDYLQISVDGGSTYKKYDAKEMNTPAAIKKMFTEAYTDLAGNSTLIIATPGKRQFKYVLYAWVTEPRSGYGALADLESLFNDETVSGNTIKIIDLKDTTVYDVILANKGNPEVAKAVTAVKFGAKSLYEVEAEFLQA